MYLDYGQQEIVDVIADLDAGTGGVDPMTWIEGLAEAAVEITDEWQSTGDE